MSTTLSGPAGREYTIGDAARLLGVSVAWIKKRETQGVLPPARRTTGGHRTYSSEELHRIREIAVCAGEALAESIRLPGGKSATPLQARIALINQKGGVGKTTLTHNLGFALGNRGFRCLLVDLDRQYNLTTCCGIDIRDERERGLGYALWRSAAGEDAAPILRHSLIHTSSPYVDLIPNNIVMFKAEAEMRHDHLSMISSFILHEMLEPLSRDYDFTLIDCPPDLGILTANGLVAAQAVLIPVDHHLSVQGLEQLGLSIRMVARHHHPLEILGVVLNRFDARTRNSQFVEDQLRAAYGDRIFRTRVSSTSRIPESNTVGQSLLDYDPRHPVAGQFRALAEEILDRVRELEPTPSGAKR